MRPDRHSSPVGYCRRLSLVLAPALSALRDDIAPPRAVAALPPRHLKPLRVREQSRTGALRDVPTVKGGDHASGRSSTEP